MLKIFDFMVKNGKTQKKKKKQKKNNDNKQSKTDYFYLLKGQFRTFFCVRHYPHLFLPIQAIQIYLSLFIAFLRVFFLFFFAFFFFFCFFFHFSFVRFCIL